MKGACWDTRATDSIIKSGQKDTEASITFIIRLQCNILHFLVNRVNEPHVGSKMAIILELKLCLSNFSRGVEKQKLRCVMARVQY